VSRKRYVPIRDILDQLWKKLGEGVVADYITLSGSGEPTLNSDISELIDSIKKRTDIPVAVLTNGSLLWQRDVQQAILRADVVLPSLDAGDADVFRRINRPHPDVVFEKMVEGLAEFRRVYRGEIWLEVLLVNDVNSEPSHIAQIKRHVDVIRPDTVQLNTVVRPSAEDFAKSVPSAVMLRAKQMLGDRAEVIADYDAACPTEAASLAREEVVALLRRRPCTLEDMVTGLSVHRNELVKHLTILEQQGLVQKVERDNRVYYQIGAAPAMDDSSGIVARGGKESEGQS